MSPLRLNGSTSGYSQIDAPAVAGDQTFTLPGTGGTLDRLNRAGNILQVVTAAKTDTFTTTSTSFTDITGLTVSITPTSASSKILVLVQISCQGDVGVDNGSGRVLRDSTAISVGDAAGSRTRASFGIDNGPIGQSQIVMFVDSPNTTSSTTYKVQVKGNTGGVMNINRTDSDSDSANTPRTASSITVMEVAA